MKDHHECLNCHGHFSPGSVSYGRCARCWVTQVDKLRNELTASNKIIQRNRRIATVFIVMCLILLLFTFNTASGQEISLGREMTTLEKVQRIYGKRMVIWNKSQWSVMSAPRFAHSDTITVFTATAGNEVADRELATRTLLLAEQYRKEIATELFGRELPRKCGKITINVAFGDTTRGLTWVIDTPLREYHVIYLTLASLSDLETALATEMGHCVWASVGRQ